MMRPQPHEQKPMQPIGNHPYAHFHWEYDPMGQLWIYFGCTKCGDRSQKPCMNPDRVNLHAFRYASLHAHGLRPSR